MAGTTRSALSERGDYAPHADLSSVRDDCSDAVAAGFERAGHDGDSRRAGAGHVRRSHSRGERRCDA